MSDQKPPWFPSKETIFDKLFEVIDTTEPTADIQQLQKIFVPAFDNSVDYLRRPDCFPNPVINRLACLLWQIIGNKVVPLGVSDTVKSIHFWMEVQRGSKESRFASVILPLDWVDQLRRDPWMTLGGIVCIGSQAADFFHDRWESQASIYSRAYAYESEFYRTVQCLFAGQKSDTWRVKFLFNPNKYQQQVIEKFPKGLDSLPREEYYDLRPYTPGDFRYIDNT